ncbi:MAG: hypothetical protein N2049_04430 [Anaerolineales bacterium]|nr:hypothetical protein [Anaerolineales bacterium]MCX7608449.1 hypothetical protein [Anaerolineales bacterium]MDW8228181.1 hypothetical protein [Anaerolineales bacterium]
MSPESTPKPRPSPIRRFWKPALATGAGGSAILIWLEEIIALAVEIFSIILVAILGGVIFLFNHLVFKNRFPRREDLQNPSNGGKKH